MAFGEVLKDIRTRRHIPMREFSGISPSFIHGIENDNYLPGEEKLETIKTHIGKVAVEQGSDGEQDIQELQTAWYEDHFVRLGVDPQLAPSIAKLLALEPEQQVIIARTIETAFANPDRQA